MPRRRPALAVVRDGRVIKESGYGLASVELEVPVGSSTVFEIGLKARNGLLSSISAGLGRRSTQYPAKCNAHASLLVALFANSLRCNGASAAEGRPSVADTPIKRGFW